jgi:hypothetical protein
VAAPELVELGGVDDREMQAELLRHLVLPLQHQARRADYHDPLGPVPEQEFQRDQARLDRLAQAHVVGQQQVHARGLDGTGDRFQLVRLDDHTGTQRRLQGVHLGGGHRGPADRVEEGRQSLRRVEACFCNLRQRSPGQDAAAGLDLPDHRERVAVPAVFDALQGQQGAVVVTAGYWLLAHHPSLPADLHQGSRLRYRVLCRSH